jgi:hypothetical protein
MIKQGTMKNAFTQQEAGARPAPKAWVGSMVALGVVAGGVIPAMRGSLLHLASWYVPERLRSRLTKKCPGLSSLTRAMRR